MNCLLVLFAIISFAKAGPVMYGAGLGGIYPQVLPNVAMPLYAGYPIAKQVTYGNQMGGGGGYYGGNSGYNDFGNTGMAAQTLRNNGQMARQGAQNTAGNHVAMNGNEGMQGVHHAAAGSAYNQGGRGFLGGAKQYGLAGKSGFGGFGNAGHRKGQRTSGFHKSYHNVESGKDSSFLDEDHDRAEEQFGNEAGKSYNDLGWNGYREGRNGGLFGENFDNHSGARGAVASTGIQGGNWDSRDRQAYAQNQDMAYNNALMQSNRNQNAGMGQTMGGGGVNGVQYAHPQVW